MRAMTSRYGRLRREIVPLVTAALLLSGFPRGIRPALAEGQPTSLMRVRVPGQEGTDQRIVFLLETAEQRTIAGHLASPIDGSAATLLVELTMLVPSASPEGRRAAVDFLARLREDADHAIANGNPDQQSDLTILAKMIASSIDFGGGPPKLNLGAQAIPAMPGIAVPTAMVGARAESVANALRPTEPAPDPTASLPLPLVRGRENGSAQPDSTSTAGTAADQAVPPGPELDAGVTEGVAKHRRTAVLDGSSVSDANIPPAGRLIPRPDAVPVSGPVMSERVPDPGEPAAQATPFDPSPAAVPAAVQAQPRDAAPGSGRERGDPVLTISLPPAEPRLGTSRIPVPSPVAEASAVSPRPESPPGASAALTAVPAEADLPAGIVGVLMKRGAEMVAIGDISAARRLYERAALSGNDAAAAAAGRMYDPNVLASIHVQGIQPNPEMARYWYRRAAALGVSGVATQLQALATASTR